MIAASVTLRQAGVSDWRQLRQVVKGLFPGMRDADIADQLCRHPGGTAVACSEREIVGYSQIEPRDDSGLAWLNYLGVLPRWRGKGFGVSLLRRCESHCRDQRFAAIALDVFDNNPHALEFYERSGYILLAGPARARSQGKLRLGKLLREAPVESSAGNRNMPSIAPAGSLTLFLRQCTCRVLLGFPGG